MLRRPRCTLAKTPREGKCSCGTSELLSSWGFDAYSHRPRDWRSSSNARARWVRSAFLIGLGRNPYVEHSLPRGKVSLSEMAAGKAGLSGYYEAASSSYVSERGFVGQASRVSSDAEEALAAADRQTELAQAANAWYKSISPSVEASPVRHHTKHILEELGDNPLGLGTTPARYTRDAQKPFAFYRDSALASPVTLADGTPGILIRLGGPSGRLLHA